MAKFNEELENMKNKAEELADKIQPKLEGFIQLLDDISPALKGVAAAFVTYKIITWFMDLANWIGALSMTHRRSNCNCCWGFSIYCSGYSEI